MKYLGLTIVAEYYRAPRESWKLDLALPDGSRIDEYTGKRFVFFLDPDGLPLELYEK